MIQFITMKFITSCERLEDSKSLMPQALSQFNSHKEDKDALVHLERATKLLVKSVEHVEQFADNLKLIETNGRCKRFKRSLEMTMKIFPGGVLKKMTSEEIASEIGGIQESLQNELWERRFAFIPPEKAEFFEKDGDAALFGDKVYQNFKSVRIEIKDAGNCLAADLNTAAVFHLMRVAEIGLRALARRLKVTIKKMTLEYADWGTIIFEIEEKIKLKKPKSRGKKQSEALEFYHGAIGEFNAFKDVWRNNVMHTRKSYDEKEAIRVFNHVRGFMQRLATKLSE
jgi:hypothetical protein